MGRRPVDRFTLKEVGLVAERVIPMQVGGIELMVETTPVAGSEPTSRLDRAGEQVTDAFEQAQAAILEVASSTVGMIHRMGEQAGRPNGVTVEFGLKFSASGNVIVAGAAGEATLQVALSYGPTPAG